MCYKEELISIAPDYLVKGHRLEKQFFFVCVILLLIMIETHLTHPELQDAFCQYLLIADLFLQICKFIAYQFTLILHFEDYQINETTDFIRRSTLQYCKL